MYDKSGFIVVDIRGSIQAPVGGSTMARPMDNMPFSEFYKWLSSPSFAGPVGLVAKLYLKEGQREEFLKIMEDSVAHTKVEVRLTWSFISSYNTGRRAGVQGK